MASYREFREETLRRRRKRTLQRALVIFLALVVILALAWLIVRLIGPKKPEEGGLPADPMGSTSQTSSVPEGGSAEGAVSTPQSAPASAPEEAAPAQESALAPLPMQNVDGGDQSWNTVGPVEQTVNFEITAPDYRMLSLPENGVVDMSYFETATFLGDSISQSFAVYTPEVPGKKVAAIGAGPQTVVNGVEVKLSRGDPNAVNMLDTVVESKPDNLYVLMGTNTLVNTGNEDQFLAYYGKMLDMLKERLDPRVRIYVQAITPVREDNPHVQGKAGLRNERLRAVNSRLAALAIEKGCLFLDLQEVFADADGNMKAEYAAADGIHLNKEGTQAWVDYLSSHTLYHRRNPYLYGSPYYIEE